MAGRWVLLVAAVAILAAACADQPADVLQREESVAPPTLPPTPARQPGTWQPLDFVAAAGAEAVWTGRDVLVFHRADPSPEDASLVHLDPDSGAVTEASLDGSPIAGSIVSHWTWTGRELLVWALGIEGRSYAAQGAAYDPASGTWRLFASTPVDTGTPVEQQVGVAGASVGGEVLVWSHGVAFDPVTGASRAVAVAPLTPSTRSAVATTEQVLVWGGSGTEDWAAYDPATDTWTVVPRSPLLAADRRVAVWSGTEVLVWEGSAGAAYDPALDTWRALPAAPVHGTAAVWSGTELLLAAGAAYDPGTNGWRTLPPPPLPVAEQVTAVWTGEAMVVLGTTGSAVYRPSVEAPIGAVSSSAPPTVPAGGAQASASPAAHPG